MTRAETKEIKYALKMNIKMKEKVKHIEKRSSTRTVWLPP